jgi:ketosteroid isomerase-like protein
MAPRSFSIVATTWPFITTQVTGVVVLEYASQGRVVATGAPYSNRYISVLSIVDRKVAHWRDYLDPLAVFDAFGWPAAAADSD